MSFTGWLVAIVDWCMMLFGLMTKKPKNWEWLLEETIELLPKDAETSRQKNETRISGASH